MQRVNKKQTVSESSVGADAKQPVSNNKIIIAEKQKQIQPQILENFAVNVTKGRYAPCKKLEIKSMTELYDTVYPSVKPVVEGLLYNGTYLFAGAPKIGKSFFMAQLGYHVSKGIPLWGYPVVQGTVL